MIRSELILSAAAFKKQTLSSGRLCLHMSGFYDRNIQLLTEVEVFFQSSSVKDEVRDVIRVQNPELHQQL